MEIIITVKENVFNEFNQNNYTSEISKNLINILKKHQVILKPIFINSEYDKLRQFFLININSEQTAANLLDELWKSGAITSGFIKPNDESPI